MSVNLTRRVEALRLPPFVVKDDVSVGPRGPKITLAAIAWFVWDSRGETDRKTVRQIAARAGYSLRATKGHLAVLEADGAITSAGRAGDPKGRRYRINSAWLDVIEGGNPCNSCPEPVQFLHGSDPEPVQFLHPKSPTERVQQETHRGDAREDAPAAPREEVAANSADEKEASRIEGVPLHPSEPPPKRRSRPQWSPLPPDDWEPTPESVDLVLAEGYSLDDIPMIRDRMFDWHVRTGRGSCDWDREFVAEARHHAPKHIPQSRPRPQSQRLQERDAFLAKVAAKQGLREGDVIVGVVA